MKKILTANPESLRITQDYLVPKQLKKYLNLPAIEGIPPIPVAEDLVTGGRKYCVLDGHNFLASLSSKGQNEVPIWVCESEYDFLLSKDFPSCSPKSLSQRNEQIKKRYKSARFQVPMVRGKEIFDIKELIELYL